MEKMRLLLLVGLAVFLGSSCQKVIRKDYTFVRDVYELDTLIVYNNSSEKNKQKSPRQLVSVMHTDVFRTNIQSQTLQDLDELFLAVGDKSLANLLLAENWVQSPVAQIPTKKDMRENIEQFVLSTYTRFFQRKPNEYELKYMEREIEADTSITPEMIYIAFAESNEYLFY